MKALVKAKAEEGIWLEDIPEPEIGPNDVLVKVRKTAICGTDIHIYNWDKWAQDTIPVPMQVGHEFCGEIVDMGSEVQGLALGQRVIDLVKTRLAAKVAFAGPRPLRLQLNLDAEKRELPKLKRYGPLAKSLM